MDEGIGERERLQVEGIFNLIRNHSHKIMTNKPAHTVFKGRKKTQGMPIN